jgi:predicted RNase H-like nuclease (RuvC/YqgF family)
MKIERNVSQETNRTSLHAAKLLMPQDFIKGLRGESSKSVKAKDDDDEDEEVDNPDVFCQFGEQSMKEFSKLSLEIQNNQLRSQLQSLTVKNVELLKVNSDLYTKIRNLEKKVERMRGPEDGSKKKHWFTKILRRK